MELIELKRVAAARWDLGSQHLQLAASRQLQLEFLPATTSSRRPLGATRRTRLMRCESLSATYRSPCGLKAMD